ncbi:hypothetical protein [Hymenobacter volaticus]|uniref:Tetratricopeptide repeat protein n=1 Tax=Hymenobacter volaticus TaxID=2932254 RepID=A0ABY4G7Y7_9BACT|nr:hypothetical protein [Hymenobacter volaticus]UOQ66877.1 hypothetical protein MUN86_02885 [Hymenobacter volaticus]
MQKYLLLFFLLALLIPGQLAAQTRSQDVLTDIQRKISWHTSLDSLRLMAKTLDDLRATKPNAYLNYWGAYTQYHLYFRAAQNKTQAEKHLVKGIEMLEAVPTKTAEHYALLSLLQGLNLEFASFLTVVFKANTAKDNAEKAVALAPDNLRAHYARGVNDFHTPKQYGGGKVAIAHLKKAIAAPEKPDPNPYAPTGAKPTPTATSPKPTKRLASLIWRVSMPPKG